VNANDEPLPPSPVVPAGPLDAPPDAADLRMAELLRDSSSSSAQGLRAELEGVASDEATDLMGRLHALDFVNSVVGGGVDVPSRIGVYAIKGVLGRGGMGTVYLGWQPDLEREVALKVLAPSYTSDPTMRKRFRAEAKATAALHHRHIVPIYDYGEAGGVLFFAMERVDGMSLDKHIAASRRVNKCALDPLDAARRFAGVADALSLAHRRRLLHRDVKPGNILVGKDGTLALTDFGLAKALDHASMHLTSKGGGFLGTLHYASPEQAMGDELSPASDLYSLGVTIFEAVAGELPLAGKTTEAMLQSILHGTPRRLRDFVPKPPRDLEAVLDKLLSREPGDRYQDGENLARDLQRIADGEPVHIRRLPLHVRIWRRARKNPVLAAAIAAAGLLLLATLTLFVVLRRETGRSLVSRHLQHLSAIQKTIADEPGSPFGPSPLLAALTGGEFPAEQPNSTVLRELERAKKDLPDDPQVAAMREAYLQDPAPVASELLAQGRGFEAVAHFDAGIAAAKAQRSGGALDVELRLHRLYLGRGVANLTACLSRPNDARTDLALAVDRRPGALFPRALLDLLDVVQADDPGSELLRLEREQSAAAGERRQVFGRLLWSASALLPPQQSNLMDFGLTFPSRQQQPAAAQRWLANAPANTRRCGEATGLAAELLASCREALSRSGDAESLRQLTEAAERAITTAVHPDSQLQGLQGVLQLLRDPVRGGPLVDARQQPLPPTAQLAAWAALLQISPSREKVQRWLRRFEELQRNHPNMPGLAAIAAKMHHLAASPDALAWAKTWVVEAEGDPEAWLTRMSCQLRAGAIEDARDDAMVAVQEAVSPTATLAEVVRLCQESAPSLDAGAAELLRLLTQRFRTLLEDAVGAEGGR
jgi:serine/threonine protein kinase